MTNLRRVHAEFRMTYSLGQFNTVSVGASLEEYIQPEDDFDRAYDILYQRVMRKVFSKLDELIIKFNVHKQEQDTNKGNM